MHSAAIVDHPIVIIIILLDSCTINNGGCGNNTICSHDSATYAVRCRCKTGYTNTGSSAKLNCTGTTTDNITVDVYPRLLLLRCRQLLDQQWWMQWQCRLRARFGQLCSHLRLQTRIHQHRLIVQCPVHRYTISRFPTTLEHYSSVLFSSADSCLVSNGGCGTNAVCSHDPTTFAVVCTCKTGFTNVGSSSNVTCQGESNRTFALLIALRSDDSRQLSREQWWMRWQCYLLP